jgi:hypothetical protein
MNSMFTTQQFSDHVWNEIVQSLTVPDIRTLASAVVDDKMWYTVKLSMPAQTWIRCQPREHWHELESRSYVETGCFDVSEQLYTVLNLKWN